VNVLEWDTDFFGVRIGRADLADETVAAAVDAARRERVECLYLAAPAERPDLVTEAARAGALLVDVRLELDAEPGELAPQSGVRIAGAGDGELVEQLAAELSTHSRFRADPRFDEGRVAEMYRIWARRCLADGVAVLAEDGRGLVAASRSGDEARLDLVYVSPESSGRGLGAALAREVLRVLDAPRALVVTQAGNVPALRMYESLGFRARAAGALLHLWLGDLDMITG
jgi:ribosomal protein S18 acetylase RimI-like enzyme